MHLPSKRIIVKAYHVTRNSKPALQSNYSVKEVESKKASSFPDFDEPDDFTDEEIFLHTFVDEDGFWRC